MSEGARKRQNKRDAERRTYINAHGQRTRPTPYSRMRLLRLKDQKIKRLNVNCLEMIQNDFK